jgi:hypothetical protein
MRNIARRLCCRPADHTVPGRAAIACVALVVFCVAMLETGPHTGATAFSGTVTAAGETAWVPPS